MNTSGFSPLSITGLSNPLASQLVVSHDTFLSERPSGAEEDVHMVASIVDHIIERCSAPGDTVFDPFAGFGTTIARAIALGRQAIGIELLPERVEQLRTREPQAIVVEGDARELLRITRSLTPETKMPQFDLILTSPPYMTETHHEADPLTAYERDGGDYRRYLAELSLIAAQCATVLAPAGFIVWNVADIYHEEHRTELIRDCRSLLEEHFVYVGQTDIEWDQYPHDLVQDALLVFQLAT